jgi:hypothetical protein
MIAIGQYEPEDSNHPELGMPVPDDPDNKGIGIAGPLSLDYVSNINFGMNDYTGGSNNLSSF